jgi:hypothetical protein
MACVIPLTVYEPPAVPVDELSIGTSAHAAATCIWKVAEPLVYILAVARLGLCLSHCPGKIRREQSSNGYAAIELIDNAHKILQFYLIRKQSRPRTSPLDFTRIVIFLQHNKI